MISKGSDVPQGSCGPKLLNNRGFNLQSLATKTNRKRLETMIEAVVEENRSQMVSAINGRKTSGGTTSNNTSTTANSPSFAQSGDSFLPNTIDDRPATEV